MNKEGNSDRGICLLSFDGGGPGTYSQLLLIKEYMSRLAVEICATEELYPADYFDMMGGVGFGGLAALILGHLRMTVDEAIDTLLTIAAAVFPHDPDTRETPETNMLNLRCAIEEMLEKRSVPLHTKLYDKGGPLIKCKVSIYAAASTDVSQPKIFRTYPHRGSSLNPTIVEALCATMAIPSFFPPVTVGPRGRGQSFVGGPLGASNPTRELLKEAGMTFGQDGRVAQVISLGTGRPGIESLESMDPEDMPGQLLKSLYTDCETVASELSTRLINIDAYVRLNVQSGPECSGFDDWRGLSTIERSTSAYVETSAVNRLLEESLRYLQNRVGTATFAQINQSANIKRAIKTAPAVSPYHVVRQKGSLAMIHHLVDFPSSNQKIFVITGVGGCGKTQMVSYFLQEKGFHYVHAVFVDASSLSSLKADLQAWAQSLGDGHEQDVWEDALRVLSSDLYKGRWILVFDNADNLALNLAPFFPKCFNGCVLITSRNRSTGDLANTHHLELGEMEVDEALSTLLRAAQRHEPLSSEELKDANSLIKMLGYLPVALVQAGTYCHQLSTIIQGISQPFTFAQYTNLFFLERADLMKKPESSSLDIYQLGAYTAFDISYKAIPSSAKEFLHFVASFQHSSISLALFSRAAQDLFGDPYELQPRPDDHQEITDSLKELLCKDGEWNELRIHDTIRTLRSFSLISASSVDNNVFVHLHPLVCSWARDILPSDTLGYQRMSTQVITSCGHHDNIQLYRHMAPHIHDLLPSTLNDSQHVNDLLVAGMVKSDQAQYDDAEGLLTHAMERLKDLYGSDHGATTMVAQRLVLTYRSHGKWDKAEELQLDILEQHRRFLGGNHIGTTLAFANLAGIYVAQGRSSDAEKIQVELLEKLRRTEGDGHILTTVVAGDLAVAYHNQGRLREAEELESEILELRRNLFGKDTELSMVAANNLAYTYRAQGRTLAAESLQLELWEQRKRIHGKNHKDTLIAAERLSGTYAAQGRLKEAEELRVEVVQQQQKLIGDSHPDTLGGIANLATLYMDQGRWSDAERLNNQVLEHGKRLGEDHPEIIKAAGNLAVIYATQGKRDQAEKLEVEVLERRTRLLGKNHPDTLSSRSNLATVLMDQGRYKEAEELQYEVLHQEGMLLGADHPNTMLSANNLAEIYYAQGRWGEAEKLELEVLERRRRVLGHEHLDTLKSMSGLATTYSAQGRSDEADELRLEIWTRRLQLLGKDHPDTISAAGDMVATYVSQQRYEQAEKLQLDVLEQRKMLIGKEHPLTVTAAANLAVIYSHQGRVEEAEKLELDVLEQRTRLSGREHPDTMLAAANLARNYVTQGRLEEAEKLNLEVLERRTRLMGIDHPLTIGSLVGLAGTYCSQRRIREAELLLEDALKRQRRVIGEDHPDTMVAANLLFRVYSELEKWSEAELLGSDILERQRKLLGEDHMITILAASELAVIYMHQGRYNEAEGLQLKTLEQNRRLKGRDTSESIGAAEILSFILREQGRYMEAAGLQSDALERKRTLLGLVHRDTLTAEVNLIGIYMLAQEWYMAASALFRAVDATLGGLGKANEDTQQRVSMLTALLVSKFGMDAEAQDIRDMLL